MGGTKYTTDKLRKEMHMKESGAVLHIAIV